MITKEMLRKIAPTARESILMDLEKYLNKYLLKYEVNNYLRVCHFLAQCAHESDGFRTLEEYASGGAYEGRRDLGNTQVGDGKRFKGRGIIQLTGRANYRDMGKKLGLELEKNPLLAASGEVSVQTALEYWKSRNLNAYADLDDINTITKRINGGYNGLNSRVSYLQKAKGIIPRDFKLSTEIVTEVPPSINTESKPIPEPTPPPPPPPVTPVAPPPPPPPPPVQPPKPSVVQTVRNYIWSKLGRT